MKILAACGVPVRVRPRAPSQLMTEKKYKFTKKKVEKDALVDQYGNEDTSSVQGAIYNRPVGVIGIALFLLGPGIGVFTDSSFVGGFIWVIGCILLHLSETKKI
jgi:hypothetical protein